MSAQILPQREPTREQLASFLASQPPLPPVVSLCVPPGFTGLVTFEIKGGVIMRQSAMSESDMRCTLDDYLIIARQAGWVPTPPLSQLEKKCCTTDSKKEKPMIDNRTYSAIDLAFERKPQTVYVVSLHGYVKRCFSRDTALLHLAKFMTTKVFWCGGLPVEYAPVCEMRPEGEVWVRQGRTDEFNRAHQRCIRRLRRILAKKREMQKWCEKWDSFHDRVVQEREELQALKPAGVR